MVSKLVAQDRAPERWAAKARAPASANASDHLKEVRALKRRVQIGVYSAVLGNQVLNYFVLGFTTSQMLVVGAVAFSIAIVGVEGGFAHGLQLRKRSAYPRVVLAELGGVYKVSEAAPRALAVLHRLLGLRASFIAVFGGNEEVSLAAVSGMSRERAERLLQAGMPKLREAMSTKQAVLIDLFPVLVEARDSRRESVVFIPVMALHEPAGVLVVVGEKGSRDLRDGQLLSSIGMALGLSLENLRQKETILHLAYHDALTDLPNRRLFEDRLTVALAQARRKKQMAAVICLDLDRFKVVNDTMGHAMGDQLLKSVAERLTGLIRDSDTVARMGGDEFTLLLPDVARAEDTAEVAERTLEALRQPWVLNGHEFCVTASIGIAMCPNDAEDAESLLRNADTAMYRAKDSGRDNYKLYNPTVDARKMLSQDGRPSRARKPVKADR
jgi:diguanylate cyclase (GGDEF)-like protein